MSGGQSRSSRPSRVLIIDDDPVMKALVQSCLSAPLYEILQSGSISEGLRAIEDWHPDVVLLDHQLPDGEGFHAIAEINGIDRQLPILYVTAASSATTAIEASRRGVFDYLTKPLVLKNLAHQISRALESRALLHRPVIMNARAAEGSQEADLLVGQSMAMIEVYKAIGRIAAHQLPALITGESGTGKQLVARAIHQHGPRSGHPIWVIDCADHGPSELESMLNPAVENSIMRKAMHGTLLLKNLSAIHHGVQFKLVQLIREAALRQNQMVGLPNLIFTSGLQPEQLVEQKHVRPDLFYDLIGGTIRLPPLRSREGDLPLLVAYYLGRFANVRSVAETTPPRISSAAMQLLLRHRWPGNVTELKSVIRRALIETQGTILPSDFLSQLLNESSSTTDSFHQPLPTGPNLNASGAKQVGSVEFWRSFVEANAQDTDPRLYLKAIELLEQGLIGATFEYTKGNLSQAARLLGMTRVSLRKKSKPGARVIEDEENNLD